MNFVNTFLRDPRVGVTKIHAVAEKGSGLQYNTNDLKNSKIHNLTIKPTLIKTFEIKYKPAARGIACPPFFRRRVLRSEELAPPPLPSALFRDLEPTKFVILRIFEPNFVQIWQFWCRWKAGDEIYSNLAKLNWAETTNLPKSKIWV